MSSVFQENRKMLGVWVDDSVGEKLGLLSVIGDKSRSTIIECLIINHVKNTSFEEMVNSLSFQIIQSYLTMLQSSENIEWNSFLRQVRTNLKKKKLKDTTINSIIQKVEYEKKSCTIK